MCSVPKMPEIKPILSFDAGAGKAARVKTAASRTGVKKKKSGLAALSSQTAGGSISDLLAGLTIGTATPPPQ